MAERIPRELRPTIPKHSYESDPQSGAGNCWCGRASVSQIHPEHPIVPAAYQPEYCCCGVRMYEHPEPASVDAALQRLAGGGS